MTKRMPIFLLLVLTALVLAPVLSPLQAQDKKPATLRDVLLAELRFTHTNAEWFVPANTAVKGLPACSSNSALSSPNAHPCGTPFSLFGFAVAADDLTT